MIELLTVAVLFVAQEPATQNPADAVLAIRKDLLGISAEARLSVRYLTLHNLPDADRAEAIKVLNGHVQHLSRETDLQRLHVVPGTHQGLLRLNLEDYRWSRDLWEGLAAEDPWYHVDLNVEQVTTEVVPWRGGVWPGDGKFYGAGTFTVERQVKRKSASQRALSPVLTETEEHKRALAEVVTMTGSSVPLLRADWFFNQTAAAVNRKTNYYSFLGVKTEKDFQKLGGFDAKLAENFLELRDAIALSGVTLQPRAVLRNPAIGGSYWRTFDFKVARDETDPLRIIGKDVEKKHDASEQYVALPNGFWAMGAFDGKGVAQESVPDSIATDGHSKSNDKRIHPNVSCMRCHDNGGLQDLDAAWFRSLVRNGITFNFPDYATARAFRQQYVSRKLEPFLKKDRDAYGAAVKEATGFATAKEYSAAYADFWERYEDARVGLAWAAGDLGTTEKTLKAAIIGNARALQADPVILGLAVGKAVPMKQWEHSYHLAYTTLRQHQGAK
jgi:hypothetical protein